MGQLFVDLTKLLAGFAQGFVGLGFFLLLLFLLLGRAVCAGDLFIDGAERLARFALGISLTLTLLLRALSLLLRIVCGLRLPLQIGDLLGGVDRGRVDVAIDL